MGVGRYKIPLSLYNLISTVHVSIKLNTREIPYLQAAIHVYHCVYYLYIII